MKIKHLIIVSLLLAVLTIGAVSASEDIADDLTVNEESVDEIAAPTDDELIADSDESDSLEESTAPEEPVGLTADDFNVTIEEEIDVEDDDYDVDAVSVESPDDAEGEIKVQVKKGIEEYYNTFDPDDSPITLNDLDIYSTGKYDVTVSFVPTEGEELILKTGTITVSQTYSISDFDYEFYYYEGEPVENKYATIFSIDPPINGTLMIYVDGKNVKNKTFENYQYFKLEDLAITKDGSYNVSSKFIAEDGQEYTFDEHELFVKIDDWNQITDDYVELYSTLNILSHRDYIGSVGDYEEESEYVIGTVTLFIDGKQYYTKQFTAADKKYELEITVDDLNIYNNFALGKHLAKLVYNKNNTKEYIAQRTVEFLAEPDVIYEHTISVGEKQSIDVIFYKGTTGTVTLYNAVYDEEDDYKKTTVFKQVTIANGKASIPLDGLAKGEHTFILNISSNTYQDERDIYINVKENTPGITASVSPSQLTVGGIFTVTFNGNKSDEKVYIEVDGKEYKSVALVTGSISETIVGLTVGQHKIRVSFDDGNKYFSKTFPVVVKAKETPKTPAKAKVQLTLKKIKTVKKSAKKLVLKATLKINGKYAKKGTKVVFKFNGKKYTAKVKAKGVAKLTIKKKVLKKLKKGKKVKVQASYGGKTVKYSIKVKK